MRFILDESISPLVGPLLAAGGHDLVHVHDLDLTSEPDPVILAAAVRDGRVLVTLDTDFGALVAHSGAQLPSMVLFRGDVTRRPLGQAELLLTNLDQFADDLHAGAVVVIGDDRIRVRRPPPAVGSATVTPPQPACAR